MSKKEILNFEEPVIYVQRSQMAEAIHKTRVILLAEAKETEEKLQSLVKNRGSAVKLLVALQRDESTFTESTLYVLGCLKRIKYIEERVETMNRVLQSLPEGEYIVRLSAEKAAYYGL